jgi:hypothetical protein
VEKDSFGASALQGRILSCHDRLKTCSVFQSLKGRKAYLAEIVRQVENLFSLSNFEGAQSVSG